MTHAHGGLLVLLVALGGGALLGNVLVAIACLAVERGRLSGWRHVAERESRLPDGEGPLSNRKSLPAAREGPPAAREGPPAERKAGEGIHALDRLAPSELSRLALVGLLLPTLCGVVAMAIVLVIPVLALGFPELDHCLAHPHAPHVCFAHGTFAFSSMWEAAGVLLLLGAFAFSLGKECTRLWRARRLATALLLGSSDLGSSNQSPAWTKDEVPYAFAVGVFRPRIIASAGLRRALNPEQLRAAFAHERAHVVNHDALWRVVVRIFSFLLLPVLRRPLLALLILGQEKRADDVAGAFVGSRALVAETLLVLIRSARVRPHLPDAPGLGGNALESRIEALCREPARGRLWRKLLLGLAIVACTFVAAQAQVHAGAETMAGVLFSTPVHAHDVVPASSQQAPSPQQAPTKAR